LVWFFEREGTTKKKEKEKEMAGKERWKGVLKEAANRYYIDLLEDLSTKGAPSLLSVPPPLVNLSVYFVKVFLPFPYFSSLNNSAERNLSSNNKGFRSCFLRVLSKA